MYNVHTTLCSVMFLMNIAANMICPTKHNVTSCCIQVRVTQISGNNWNYPSCDSCHSYHSCDRAPSAITAVLIAENLSVALSQYSTVQYSTVQYSTVQYSTEQHCAVL